MWNSISVIIPVYNGEECLEELYTRLADNLKRLSWEYEIVLVDDGSSDNSYEKMKLLHQRDRRVKVIRLAGNFGQQNALFCGLHYTTGDYVVTMDDDLQHNPEDIEKLLLELDKGYQVVYGIPLERKHPFYRQVGSKVTYYLFNRITTKPPGLKISSFRVIRRELVEKIIKEQTSFVYISAIIFRYTSQVGNVTISHASRKHGESNYNFRKLLKTFLKIYIYYSNSRFLKYFTSSGPAYIIRDEML